MNSLKIVCPLIARVITLALMFALRSTSEASPLSLVIHSELKTTKAKCVFPDGSTPMNRPEIHCYDPKTFLKAYGIDQLHAAELTGKGQVIILANSFGSPTLQQDLDHFSETFGLPKTQVQFIYPNGPYVNDLASAEKVAWAGETTLDVEWAHAVAPDATLVNIVTNVSETVGLTGFPELFKGIEMATEKYPGSIISMSFAAGEPTFTPTDVKDYVQGSFHQILQNATNADISLIAGSGDSGTTNLDAKRKNLIPYANANYPASDPLVTAVGGTALEAGWKWAPEESAEEYWSNPSSDPGAFPKDFFASIDLASFKTESVWKEDWAFAAGGGGISTFFEAPTYQLNLSSPVKDQVKGKRAIPDVSFNAAVNGGVEVYSSYSAPSFGAKGPSWQNIGGTSAATPEIAGLVALAGQKASESLAKTVGIGFLNKSLYALPDEDYHDILPVTFGSNQQVTLNSNALYYSFEASAANPKRVPSVFVPGFLATTGFDLATGLGSPRAEKFVLDLAAARVARRASEKHP